MASTMKLTANIIDAHELGRAVAALSAEMIRCIADDTPFVNDLEHKVGLEINGNPIRGYLVGVTSQPEITCTVAAIECTDVQYEYTVTIAREGVDWIVQDVKISGIESID